MKNPFRYGNIATGEYFTNRVSELRALESDMRSGQNVVIISPRRYGKTSLVSKALDSVRQDGLLTAYIDLFNAPTKERLVQLLADAIFKGLESPFEQRVKAAREIFKNLSVKPVFTLGDDGKPAMELAPAARAADVDRDLDQLLHMPQEIADRRGKHVLLVIDEFQEILSIDPHLLGRMRAIFQHQTAVSHIYMGSRFHLMNEVFNDINQPFYRSAKHLPLEPIRAEDFQAFIRERFSSTGKMISPEVVDRLLNVTGCHPNDTQELCHFVWAEAHAHGGDPCPDDVDRALAQILASKNDGYTYLWEGLPASQKMLLMALSREEGAMFSEDYRRRHGLGATTTVQRAAKSLRDREIIEQKAGGGFHVLDVFLRHWLALRAVPS